MDESEGGAVTKTETILAELEASLRDCGFGGCPCMRESIEYLRLKFKSPAINTASGRAYETCETLEEAVEWYVGDIGAQPVDREEAAFRAGAHWASAKRDEVSRESINQLAGELEECRDELAFANALLQSQASDFSKSVVELTVKSDRLAEELDLRLKQIADLKHALEARMETEKRLLAALEQIAWARCAWQLSQEIARAALKARGGE